MHSLKLLRAADAVAGLARTASRPSNAMAALMASSAGPSASAARPSYGPKPPSSAERLCDPHARPYNVEELHRPVLAKIAQLSLLARHKVVDLEEPKGAFQLRPGVVSL